jgi:integrase
MTLFTLTAARVGAIARLTRADVLLAQPLVPDADDVLILHEKNAKERRLPLTSELRRVLVQWLQRLGPSAPESPVFPSLRSGNPTARSMTEQDILRMVRRRLAVAGLSGTRWTCHSFRAGAATALLEAGVELTRVQDLLGHADPRTSRMYDARSRQVRAVTLNHLQMLFKPD